MAHYEITRYPALSGHNLDGTEQESDPFYELTDGGVPIYQHEGFFQTLDHLKRVLSTGDRVTMDVEV